MGKFKKNLFIAFILCILCILYVYICAIDSIPDSVILFKGEELNVKTIFGLSLISKEDETVFAVSSIDEETTTTNVEVKLFDSITIKELSISVIEEATIVPVGELVGLKIYTNGVLVVGMTQIQGEDGNKYDLIEDSGIEEGDIIIQINDTQIIDTDQLQDIINSSNGEALNIIYTRDNEIFETNITPIKTNDEEYKIGLWVRDSAAGVGTITFYDIETGYFAALGHGITDVDTGELLDISDGEVVTTEILSVTKGEEGNPGKIQGTIENQDTIGIIYENTNIGIYGAISDIDSIDIDLNNSMEVALRDEIELGEATILCSIEGETPQEYTIEIEKIYLNNNYDNKSMLIKVTDQDLIEKTGGIIQGMSGCPLIQNGQFIGAITNVLINSPEEGYAVFGDLMIKEIIGSITDN